MKIKIMLWCLSKKILYDLVNIIYSYDQYSTFEIFGEDNIKRIAGLFLNEINNVEIICYNNLFYKNLNIKILFKCMHNQIINIIK